MFFLFINIIIGSCVFLKSDLICVIMLEIVDWIFDFNCKYGIFLCNFYKMCWDRVVFLVLGGWNILRSVDFECFMY